MSTVFMRTVWHYTLLRDPIRGTAVGEMVLRSDMSALAPHPARGIAKVHIGPRSGWRIPNGPPVQATLDIDELEKVLAGLKEFE